MNTRSAPASAAFSRTAAPRDTQAVQVGGPSGVCLSAFEFDRRIGFEDVPTAGAFMVFDRSRDMFSVARNFAHFFCPRELRLLYALPGRHKTGGAPHGKAPARRTVPPRICEVLYELDKLMHGTTHCGLGAAACNPLRDTIAQVPPGL
jgi:[NiFe] hydrogenase diaphorase moiety large subunit